MARILQTLEVSQKDISGKDINDSHSLNILHILVTLDVSILDISGNDINESHSLNI